MNDNLILLDGPGLCYLFPNNNPSGSVVDRVNMCKLSEHDDDMMDVLLAKGKS